MKPPGDLLDPKDPMVEAIKTVARGVGSLLLAILSAGLLGFLSHALWFIARLGWEAFPL